MATIERIRLDSQIENAKTVLFLCTGNYYRSRFAEALFNHRAAYAGASWQAQSRGLAIERAKHCVGPVSPFALRGLEQRGVIIQDASRFPQQCTVTDLQIADYIVALDETEHRPLMRERFSDWERRIQYWTVADVPLVTPSHALSLIDAQVDKLLAVLAGLGRLGVTSIKKVATIREASGGGPCITPSTACANV